MSRRRAPLRLGVLLACACSLALCAAAPAPAAVQVHVVPHSHCDTGYKKTYSGYQASEVSQVLGAVTAALAADGDLRFVWAEASYLSEWLGGESAGAASEAQRRAFLGLVATGRVELVNGAWSMHDEAVTTWQAQLRNLRTGHAALARALGAALWNASAPRVGWQVDPFGQSSFSPRFQAEAGVDAWVTNRVGDARKAEMRANRTLQFVWRGATGGGAEAQAEGPGVLTHVLDTHYASPDGFDWESRVKVAPPVTADNVGERAEALVAVAKQRAAWYRTPHVLLPFGEDFRFQCASCQFGNMSLLIEAANAMANDTGVEFRYATASEYFAALRGAEVPLPAKRGESLLPLVDSGDPGAWTGFYSGYPALKQRIAQAGELAAAAQATAALSGQGADVAEAMVKEVSLAQHHDALPATGYAFNSADYAMRIAAATPPAERAIADAMERLLLADSGAHTSGRWARYQVGDSASVPLGISEGVGADLLVTAPAAWEASRQVVRVLVDRPDVIVRTPFTGEAVPSQVAAAASVNAAAIAACTVSDAVFELAFVASLPAAGVAAFRIETCATSRDTDPPFPVPDAGCATPAVLSEGAAAAAAAARALQSAGAAIGVDATTLLPSSIASHGMNASFFVRFATYNASKDSVYRFAGDEAPTPLALGVRALTASVGPVHSALSWQLEGGYALGIEALHDASAAQAGALHFELATPPAGEGEAIAVTLGAVAADGNESRDTEPPVLSYEENGQPGYVAQGWFDASRPRGDSYRPLVSRAWTSVPGAPSSDASLALSFDAPVGGFSPEAGHIEFTLQRRMMPQVGIDPKARLSRGLDTAPSPRRRIGVALSGAPAESGRPTPPLPLVFGRHGASAELKASASWVDVSALSSDVALVGALPALDGPRVAISLYNYGASRADVDLPALLAPSGAVQSVDARAADGIQSAAWAAARATWPTDDGGGDAGASVPAPCALTADFALAIAPRQLCTVAVKLLRRPARKPVAARQKPSIGHAGELSTECQTELCHLCVVNASLPSGSCCDPTWTCAYDVVFGYPICTPPFAWICDGPAENAGFSGREKERQAGLAQPRKAAPFMRQHVAGGGAIV